MSCYYGLHCTKDGCSSPQDFNWGDEVMRSLVRAWPHILAVWKADRSGYIEITLMGHYLSDLFAFMHEHYEHTLELENEYGQYEPLEEEKVNT